MDAAKDVTALFEQIITYTVTTNTSGTGQGTISGNSSPYPSGSQVTLTATPNTGSVFAGWNGACTNTTGDCVITNIQENKTVTALFSGTKIGRYTFDNTFNDASGSNHGVNSGTIFNSTTKKI